MQTSPTASTNLLTFKVVILGEKSVGKTSIVKRYTEGDFSLANQSTIGAQFCSKIILLDP